MEIEKKSKVEGNDRREGQEEGQGVDLRVVVEAGPHGAVT